MAGTSTHSRTTTTTPWLPGAKSLPSRLRVSEREREREYVLLLFFADHVQRRTHTFSCTSTSTVLSVHSGLCPLCVVGRSGHHHRHWTEQQ